MKIRVPVNMEIGTLDDLDEISNSMDMPRSKVTKALLRYGIDHITTKEIYEYAKE